MVQVTAKPRSITSSGPQRRSRVRPLLAGLLTVLAFTVFFVAWNSQDSIVLVEPLYPTSVSPTSSRTASNKFEGNPYEESTGTDLHLSVCGVTWEQYFAQLPVASPADTVDRPFQWTISGGDAYRDNLSIILEKWKTLGIDPILIVAMEKKTAEIACQMGFSAVHWDAPPASYSRVADAKFTVAASIADRGYQGFFIEMDVFCRKNPVPVFLSQKQDLVHAGHGHVAFYPNIGTFMASPKMGPYFRGLRKVLNYSLQYRVYINHDNNTSDFFDQNVYYHCLPTEGQNGDDDFVLVPPKYYLLNDVDRKHDLLRGCQEFKDFTHLHLPHHVMSNLNPPTVYDTTYCIHPLAAAPFSHLSYKLGVAKFYGWDPKPIGPSEKLLKLAAGDIELNDCWNRCFEKGARMDAFTFYDKIAMFISVLVEIAEHTNRTLILPQYIRDKDSWALPTHGIVNVRTLGVPYRVMSRQEFYDLKEEDKAVVIAAGNFSETLRRAADKKYGDVKVLSVLKICNLRDYKLEVLEKRQKKMGWCFDTDQQWAKGLGGWMNFCESEPRRNFKS